jgi:hypothetical protein
MIALLPPGLAGVGAAGTLGGMIAAEAGGAPRGGIKAAGGGTYTVGAGGCTTCGIVAACGGGGAKRGALTGCGGGALCV